MSTVDFPRSHGIIPFTDRHHDPCSKILCETQSPRSCRRVMGYALHRFFIPSLHVQSSLLTLCSISFLQKNHPHIGVYMTLEDSKITTIPRCSDGEKPLVRSRCQPSNPSSLGSHLPLVSFRANHGICCEIFPAY
jgi:hypothetical protein